MRRLRRGGLFFLAGCAACLALAASALERTPAPAGVKLYLISPRAGETVKSPVLVRFGLTGMGVAPAGVAFEATGHHHLIVDAPLPPADQPIPNDAKLSGLLAERRAGERAVAYVCEGMTCRAPVELREGVAL